MKRSILSVCFLISVVTNCFSQTMFQGRYSGGFEIGSSTSTAMSDGSIVFSYEIITTTSGGQPDVNIGLTRIDSMGNFIWSKEYSGNALESGNFPKETSDGNIILVGPSSLGDRILLTKIDMSGNLMWSKLATVGSYPNSPAFQTHDGGFAVAGSLQTSSSTFDTYLYRTDSTGNFLWGFGYGDSTTAHSKFVIETSDHGFLLSGSIQIFTQEDFMLIKTDSVGTIEWAKQYERPQLDIPYSAHQTGDGGYLVSFNGIGGTNAGLYLMKLFSDGTIDWVKNYPEIFAGKYSKITKNGDIVVVGSGLGSFVLMKTDSMGNIIWDKKYSNRMSAATLDFASDSGYVMIATNPTFDTLMIVKTDVNGNSGCEEVSGSISVVYPTITEMDVVLNITPTGGSSIYNLVESNLQMNVDLCNTTSVPDVNSIREFELFPNPANESLSFNFNSYQTGSFYVVNILGDILMNGNLISGTQNLDVSALKNGIYMIKFFDGESSVNKKFIIER